MSHLAYSPVGYSYNAADYCLDCISTMFVVAYPAAPDNCLCAECVLDKAAEARGIDRMDERSYDSGDFPKHIPYHNDIHSECDGEFCNSRCSGCGDVIDGDGAFCPADNRFL